MRNKKYDRCPTCCPDSKSAVWMLRYECFVGASSCWECQNCGMTKRVGPARRSERAVLQAIESINHAVIHSGSEKFPTVVEDFKVERNPQGGANVVVSAAQGGKGNMLHVISWRLIGINISPMGRITVYSDSRKGKLRSKREIARQLKDGRIHVW